MIVPTAHSKLQKSFLSDPEKSSQSVLMRDIFYKILSLAKLDSNVIVIGEIGSGKKRLANIIHDNSNRAEGPFYTFYCLDVHEEDYKDAFWGHLSFEDDHLALRYEALEKAINGTLYLDQFSELSPEYMHKIIDSYTKGCSNLFKYNKTAKPRLVISLNQESYQAILNTPSWDYLLNEINPLVIMMPPLRERKEDIPVLVEYFLNEIRENSNEYKELTISAEALCDCFNYNWPGNIRQLKNALMQGAILSYGKTIESKHLPFSMSWRLPYEFNGDKLS